MSCSGGNTQSLACLPLLSAGPHAHPRDGACFMEMASLLAGEPWSDHPRCTHPVLAALARAVNDRCSDDGRRTLAPHIPDVIGLDDRSPWITTSLLAFCAHTGLSFQPDHPRLTAARSLAMGRFRRLQAGRLHRTWEHLLEIDVRAAAAMAATDAAAAASPAGDAALVALLLGGISTYRVATGTHLDPQAQPRTRAVAAPSTNGRNHG